MSLSKTLAAHLDAIQSGNINRSNIIGMRKAINMAERQASGWSVPKGAPTLVAIAILEDAIEVHEPYVCGELHETGIKLLQSRRYVKRWTSQQANIIANIDNFALVRFDRIGARGDYCVPVYVVSDGKSSFRFRNIPWQSGGNGPEVVT